MEIYSPENTAFPLEGLSGLAPECDISFNAGSSHRNDSMEVFILGI
jgi:hypothetical protein